MNTGTLLHTACLTAPISDCCPDDGRKTENTVQLLPGAVLLFTRIEPLCLSTMPLHSHKPSPVPTSFFVVKNGSKSSERTARGMPGPESAIVSRTPDRPFLGQFFVAETRTRIAPPLATASILLLRRLVMSWRTSSPTA